MRMQGFLGVGMGLAVLLSLLLFAGTAFAESVTLFSKVYHKERGRSVTLVDRFTVPQGVTDVKLRVANGTEEAGEVKNVVIALNGVPVVGAGDLHRAPAAEKPILSALSPNTLEVTLRGQGGNAVEVTVVGTESDSEPVPPPMPEPPMGALPPQF